MFKNKNSNLNKDKKEFENLQISVVEDDKKILDLFENAVLEYKELFLAISALRESGFYTLLSDDKKNMFEKNYLYLKNSADKQEKILNCLKNTFAQQRELVERKEITVDFLEEFSKKIAEGHEAMTDAKLEKKLIFFKQFLGNKLKEFTEAEPTREISIAKSIR